ncbi:MAG: hypothetical protein FWF10_08080 [Clostridiales bacterium]|nr:hypothetical protein [Clostridiales bacterium]
MTTSNWYVLSVAAGAEQNAARKLSKITDNVAAPEQIIYRRRNNRLMAESRLLFPGYVFVQIAKLTAETYHLLKECPGVLRLLGKTGSAMPMPVPSEEMQVILGLYENYDRYLPAFREERLRFGGSKHPLLLDAVRWADGVEITSPIPPGVAIMKVDARARKAQATLRLYDEDIYLTYALRYVADNRPKSNPNKAHG